VADVQCYGEWRPEEHAEEGMPFCVLHHRLTLNLKVERMAKMLQELDKEAAVQKIWAVYAAWHNPFGEEQTVIRYARKTMEEADKQTWPLPFETEGSTFSVVLVLRDCGWSELLIASLKTVLFDHGAQHQ